MQLFNAERDHRLIRWPFESVFLQPLDHQPEARALPQQYLDAIAPPVAEYKQGRRKRIQPQRLLNEQRQSVDRLAPVHRLTVQIDFQRRVEAEHGRPANMGKSVRTSSRLRSSRATLIPLTSVMSSLIDRLTQRNSRRLHDRDEGRLIFQHLLMARRSGDQSLFAVQPHPVVQLVRIHAVGLSHLGHRGRTSLTQFDQVTLRLRRVGAIATRSTSHDQSSR